MAVILKTVLAGPGGVKQPGERLELPAAQERELVDGGYAVFVKPAGRGETATPPRRENAALPPVRRGGA